MMKRSKVLVCLGVLGVLVGLASATGMGSRVYVVERDSGSLAVYDFMQRRLFPSQITNLGNLNHATMIFTPDLRYGFLATRSGKISRIDLTTMQLAGEVTASQSSIDNAVSHDGRYIATAEYAPGGVTIIDAQRLEILKRLPGSFERHGQQLTSRVTGMVDAPGNRFVCVLMEGAEIWIIDASQADFPIEYRIPTPDPSPYDAMITPDGRYYVVGHLGVAKVSVLDLLHPDKGVRSISLVDPERRFEASAPAKLPHMASWAVVGNRVFMPLVGEKRLGVIDRTTWQFEHSIPLLGHPVYAVGSPTGREIWVSFSGEEHDAFIQVIDTTSLAPKHTLKVGRRIYHMDFTPRGSHVLASANRDNKLVLINAHTYAIEDQQEVTSPSGIFGVWRAFRIGL
jgi:protein NirF